jgi:ABC-type sulfate transport system permease subunit
MVIYRLRSGRVRYNRQARTLLGCQYMYVSSNDYIIFPFSGTLIATVIITSSFVYRDLDRDCGLRQLPACIPLESMIWNKTEIVYPS